VVVTPESKELATDLHLDPGLSIGGDVLDERGMGLAGARVVVDGVQAAGGNVRRVVVADGRGSFRLTGFRDGTYRAIGSAPGYRTASVQGIRGGDVRVRVVLPAVAPR
jgi:hypothetical protein